MPFAAVLTCVLLMAGASAPAETVFVTARDGTRLHARRVGQGPVRLIVPGGCLGLEATGWAPAGGSTVFYDMRNRCRSEAVPADRAVTIQADVSDLEDVRGHFGAERFGLVGYSYLGLMVALYAAEHPERVERIVQLGPVARRFKTEYPRSLSYTDGAWAAVEARQAELAGRSQKEICEATWPLHAAALVGDPSRASRLGPATRCEWPNEWPAAFSKHLERHFVGSVMDLDPRVETFYRVAAPVLVVHGSRDRNAPYGAGREWALTFPNARLLTVEGAAHAAWAEDDRAAAAVATFLKGAWPEGAETLQALDPADDLESILQRGRAAGAAKRFGEAAEAYAAAARLAPDNPAILFRVAEHLARAIGSSAGAAAPDPARSGEADKALSALERAAAFGVATDLELLDQAFASVSSTHRYAAVRARAAAAAEPLVASTPVAKLGDPMLMPESVAWDARRRVWYAGSMHRRKVVSVDEKGRESDLVPAARDGLWGVIGIKLDAARRELWATSYNGDSPPMTPAEPETLRHGALFRWNVDSGKLVGRYEPPFQPVSFNDLVISPKGDVYLTCDTRVCVLPSGAARVEVFTGVLGYLNGIAIADDGSRLYVADHRRGVRVVDVATRAVTPLALPPDQSLAGVDGLYLHGRQLVAIQNGAGTVERVVRGELDASLRRVERLTVVERAHPEWDVPTTGVLVADGPRLELHYVGASNLGSFYANGGLVPGKLKKSSILRLKLN